MRNAPGCRLGRGRAAAGGYASGVAARRHRVGDDTRRMVLKAPRAERGVPARPEREAVVAALGRLGAPVRGAAVDTGA